MSREGPGSAQVGVRPGRESRDHANSKRRGFVTLGVVGVLVVLLIPIGVNYVDALRAPGTDAMSARTVEWMREHGFGQVINSVERWWYTTNAPPKGGTPQGGLPASNAPTDAAVPAHEDGAVRRDPATG